MLISAAIEPPWHWTVISSPLPQRADRMLFDGLPAGCAPRPCLPRYQVKGGFPRRRSRKLPSASGAGGQSKQATSSSLQVWCAEHGSAAEQGRHATGGPLLQYSSDVHDAWAGHEGGGGQQTVRIRTPVQVALGQRLRSVAPSARAAGRRPRFVHRGQRFRRLYSIIRLFNGVVRESTASSVRQSASEDRLVGGTAERRPDPGGLAGQAPE